MKFSIPYRRLLQYRLRTLLILTTIIAVWLGWWSYKARQQREAFAWVQSVHGGYMYGSRSSLWPWQLVVAVGQDYFCTLEYIDLHDRPVTDADLERLHGLTGLKLLRLHGTQVTDAGVARLKRALPNCEIRH